MLPLLSRTSLRERPIEQAFNAKYWRVLDWMGTIEPRALSSDDSQDVALLTI